MTWIREVGLRKNSFLTKKIVEIHFVFHERWNNDKKKKKTKSKLHNVKSATIKTNCSSS